MTIMTKNSAFE